MSEDNTNKTGRGGARQGSGRKPGKLFVWHPFVGKGLDNFE